MGTRKTPKLAITLQLAGIALIGYCAFILVRAAGFQWYEQRRFEHILGITAATTGETTDGNAQSPVIGEKQNGVQPEPAAEHSPVSANGMIASPSASPGRSPEPGSGAVIGLITIPGIHLSTIVVEGDDDSDLSLGVGHIPGTALPGGAGTNVVLAAHRDTFFRPLRKISKQDEIVLTTRAGSFRYRVSFLEITDPTDVSTLRSTSDSVLTLITCYPFNYIGQAPRRFIVRATLIPNNVALAEPTHVPTTPAP